MIHYLYKIKNNINNKIYVGVHATEILPDNYMGSGLLIRNAIRKYGLSNFTKIVLAIFDNKDSAYLKEAQIVNQSFLDRTDTYNVALGGSGGSIQQNRKPFTGNHTDETKKKISEKNKGRVHTEESIKLMKARSWARTRPDEQRAHARKAAAATRGTYGIKRGKRKCKELTAEEAFSRAHNFREYYRLYGHPSKGKTRIKVKCPHCSKEGANNVMTRFHFDNCKCKPLNILPGSSVELAQVSVKD